MTPSRPDPHPCPALIFDGGVPVHVVIARYLIVTLGREFIVYAPSHVVAMDRFDDFLFENGLPWKPGVISIPGRQDVALSFAFTRTGITFAEAA